MTHKLGAGVIVLEDNKILLIKDEKGWGLPKGGTEFGESFMETALREGREETGYKIKANEVAFITEFKSKKFGNYLQVYYFGKIVGDSDMPIDPEIESVKFIATERLREYIKFRPWIIPLERWLEERTIGYYSFDLDEEGFEID